MITLNDILSEQERIGATKWNVFQICDLSRADKDKDECNRC